MSSPAPTDLSTIAFPIYGLQGGGLGRFEGNVLVFHELPDWCPAEGFAPKVGDPVPSEWGYQLANPTAHEKCMDEESPDVPHIRVDDAIRCACGEYADGKINFRGDAACSEWPGCVTD